MARFKLCAIFFNSEVVTLSLPDRQNCGRKIIGEQPEVETIKRYSAA